MNENLLKYTVPLSNKSEWVFVTTDEKIRQNMPYVQEVGYFDIIGKHSTERMGLESYQLLYLKEGSETLEYLGSRIKIEAGTIVWFDCFEHYIIGGSECAKGYFIQMNGPNVRYYYDRYISSNNTSVVTKSSSNSAIEHHIRSLIEMYKDGASYSSHLLAAERLTCLMTGLVLNVASADSDGVSQEYVTKAVKYLRNNFNQKIIIEDIADYLHISKYYLCNIFKKALGTSPKEYLIHYRIDQSKAILRQTQLPVQEVGQLVGIENSSHFIKLFKRYEKVTPAEYRKLWGNI